MKKWLKIVLIVVGIFVLLFPIRSKSQDNIIWEYKSLVYKVSKVKKLVSTEETEGEITVEEYNNGIIIEIFGFEFYNSIK